MGIALVMGASSGLGAEYVLQIAASKSKKDAVDEIWAIARRRELLEELAAAASRINPNITVRALALDLTDAAQLNLLEDEIKAKRPDVRILINAAGFGCAGAASEIGRERSAAMIDLNCRGL